MKMTRTHFQALATMCADILNNLDNMTCHDYEMVIAQFKGLCAKSNKAFDADIFMDAVNARIDG